MDIMASIEKVRKDMGMSPQNPHKGNAQKGNGWDNHYNYYCEFCNFEIQKPFIANNDPKLIKRCVECKQANQLFTRAERIQHIEYNISLLEKEENYMRQRKKLWKKFRKRHPSFIENLDDHKSDCKHDDNYNGAADSKEPQKKKAPDLPYKETEMWEANIDLDEYVDDEYHIPHSLKEVTDRAWMLRNKYAVCRKQMDLAIKHKQEGNALMKESKLELAVEAYTKSILARTDYKAAYNNRALMYFKLGQFQKCIRDCSSVIFMIHEVDSQLKKSTTEFKAYLRRASAYKQLQKLEKARKDIETALEIRPNDTGAKRLKIGVKSLLKRDKLRLKIQDSMSNDETMNDFDQVFKISIEFLQTASSNSEFEFETGHSDELLRKLLVFLSQNKKYCVRFADENGIQLTLKYLQRKFNLIKEWPEKMETLSKPFMILNYCVSKDINYSVLHNTKLKKLISALILNIFEYLVDMPSGLQRDSMRFAAVSCSIKHVKEYVSKNLSKKLVGNFSKILKKINVNLDTIESSSDPESKEKEKFLTIRCLFECIAYLCSTRQFRRELVKYKKPRLYVPMMNSLYKYYKKAEEFETRLDENDTWSVDKVLARDYEQLQFANSVILDALSVMFDVSADNQDQDEDQVVMGNIEQKLNNNSNSSQSDEPKYHQLAVESFLKHNNVMTYLKVLSKYLQSRYRLFDKSHRELVAIDREAGASAQTRKEIEQYCKRNTGILCKCVNLFMVISRATLDSHELLIKQPAIASMFVNFIPILTGSAWNSYPLASVRLQMKVLKYNFLTYFDQLSENVLFDQYMIDYLFTKKENERVEVLNVNRKPIGKNKNKNSKKLFIPAFLRFMCEAMLEQYGERRHPKLMNDFAHHKSCAIRLLYRWLQRRCKDNIGMKRTRYDDLQAGSVLVDRIIVKYHGEMVDWIKFNDLQVIANTPLVLKQMAIYTREFHLGKKKDLVLKTVVKDWNEERLRQLTKLMRTKQTAVQFNSILCMDSVSVLDPALATMIQKIGAQALIEGYKKMTQQQEAQQFRGNNMALTAPAAS